MHKLRLIHIIIVFLVLSIITLMFVSSRRSQPPTPSTTPTSTPKGITNFAPQLNITNIPPYRPSVQSVLRYNISPIIPSDFANQLAQTFNFDSPQITQFPNNTSKYSFKNGSIELNYYPEQNRLSYFNPAILNSQTPLPNSLLDQAQNFILQHLNINNLISLSLVNTVYLKSTNTVAKQVYSPAQANLIQYTFRYLLSNTPLYHHPYELDDITIVLNADGVRSLTVKTLPTIVPTDQQVSLITPEQMRLKIDQKEFILIKVNNQQYSEAGPLLDIVNMRASSTSIGYIINDNTIKPYYIISGTANNTQNPQITYQVEIAVPATNP